MSDDRLKKWIARNGIFGIGCSSKDGLVWYLGTKEHPEQTFPVLVRLPPGETCTIERAVEGLRKMALLGRMEPTNLRVRSWLGDEAFQALRDAGDYQTTDILELSNLHVLQNLARNRGHANQIPAISELQNRGLLGELDCLIGGPGQALTTREAQDRIGPAAWCYAYVAREELQQAVAAVRAFDLVTVSTPVVVAGPGLPPGTTCTVPNNHKQPSGGES